MSQDRAENRGSPIASVGNPSTSMNQGGRPLLHEQLKLDGLSETPIPSKWAEDPWVRGKFYYTLPIALQDRILQSVGRNRFTATDLLRERELAEATGEPDLYVGLWKNTWLQYAWLAPLRPVELGSADAAMLGKNPAQAQQVERGLTERLWALEEPIRGYLGWLLANAQFLDEHDELFTKYAREIACEGLPMPILFEAAALTASGAPAWVNDWRQFCSRWRLQSFAGPYLPLPWAPQVPDRLGVAGSRTAEGVVTAVVPDTFPMTGEGLLREMLNEALRGGRIPQHLATWMQIVAKPSTAKHAVSTFARQFRLQHYWRLLHLRHPAAVHRKKQSLTTAFADFLGVSSDTIKNDLKRITNSAGVNWPRRSVSLIAVD